MEAAKITPPQHYLKIKNDTESLGFTMASDVYTGCLLRTLAASKRNGEFLELGTGTGLATAWIIEGMNEGSRLTSIDNDQKCLDIASSHLATDRRLTLICMDATEWVLANRHRRFEMIFADTWVGKYTMLEEVIQMLHPGGLLVFDDMNRQPNWPEGHEIKAQNLMNDLRTHPHLHVTPVNWSTGIVLATKR